MAKQFQFRLATFLKLRESIRDDRRKELAEAYRAETLLQEQIEQTQRELKDLQQICRRAAGPGTINVDRLLEVQRYEFLLRAQDRQLHKQRELVAAEVERRRQALVLANRDVRVLEKLRERQADRYRDEQDKLHRKLMDEVAHSRSFREDEP